jgi:phosphate starvation-inducible PhoH-like protein
VRSALRIAGHEPGADVRTVVGDGISVPSRRRFISPKTLNQKRYLDAVRTHDLVIAIGPAGTGKSYLAVAMAVSALMKREVARIILTRPAVEAGERLGFLPGDLAEKVHPYLRPLYDALYDMLEPEKVATFTEKGAIEIAPLAYMRGRTLNDAFIILDEAQNTTSEQMKMFLTRLGFNAKMVITGDITQIDLPAHRPSGLVEVQGVLRGIDGISFIYFDDRDVVRHDLVSAIIRAYDRQSPDGGARRPAAASGDGSSLTPA